MTPTYNPITQHLFLYCFIFLPPAICMRLLSILSPRLVPRPLCNLHPVRHCTPYTTLRIYQYPAPVSYTFPWRFIHFSSLGHHLSPTFLPVCVCQCDFFSFSVSYDGFECEYFFIQYFITCLIHSGLSSPHCYIYLRIWSVFIILPDLHILVSIFGCTV